MPVRVHHTAIGVSDLKRAEEFYSKHFGFQRVKTFNAGQPNEFCMMEAGATILELFNIADESLPKFTDPKIGFRHVALHVDSVDKYYEQLKDEVTWTVLPRDADVFRIAFFTDADGVIVELMEEKDSSFHRTDR